jgi:hypothetical protein
MPAPLCSVVGDGARSGILDVCAGRLDPYPRTDVLKQTFSLRSGILGREVIVPMHSCSKPRTDPLVESPTPDCVACMYVGLIRHYVRPDPRAMRAAGPDRLTHRQAA